MQGDHDSQKPLSRDERMQDQLRRSGQCGCGRRLISQGERRQRGGATCRHRTGKMLKEIEHLLNAPNYDYGRPRHDVDHA